MEKIKPDLVIVYDKNTEKVANGISGRLAGSYTCLVQSDKVFENKKYEYSNNNKILFLSYNLMCQYMSMGKKTNYTIDNGYFNVYAYVYSLGNWRGIYVDIDKTVKSDKRDTIIPVGGIRKEE